MIVALPAPDPALQAIGRRVREWRERRGMERFALAQALAVDEPVLLAAERGRTRLDSAQLHTVALTLHIPVDFLFEDRRPATEAG